MPDQEKKVRRIALMMPATEERPFYWLRNDGARYGLDALGQNSRHRRGAAGYGVIRVDRLSLEKLKAKCAQLPALLSDTASNREPLSMVELIMVLAHAELEVVPEKALGIRETKTGKVSTSRSRSAKMSTLTRSGSRRQKVSTQSGSSSSRRRKAS